MCTPSRIDGFVYATNGHIAIRVKDDPELLVSDVVKFKSLPAMFVKNVDEWGSIPELPPIIPCKTCKGSGKQYKTRCDECDGDGNFDHGTHNYECKECDDGWVESNVCTENEVTCSTCDGSGEDIFSQPIKVGIQSYQRRYLAMIAALPNSKIELTPELDKVALFTFDGGEGAIMPIRA
jgi:hypothetical protein